MPNGFTIQKGKKKWGDKSPYPSEELPAEIRIAHALKELSLQWAEEPFETFGAGEYSDYDI